MKLVIKPERKVKDGERIIQLSKFQKWIIEEDKPLQTEYGEITIEELRQEKVEKFKETFYVLPASFIDSYKKIRRDRQLITLKDIGSIITSTGITRESKVLDSGTGSGGVACYLGKICKEVVSIDINEKNTELGKENAKSLGINNVKFITQDISTYEGKDFDVFILDIPEIIPALKTAVNVLKRGGFLVTYTPQIEQAISVVRNKPEEFSLEEIKEIKEIKWQVDDARSKPKNDEIGHTAFLSFFRKL